MVKSVVMASLVFQLSTHPCMMDGDGLEVIIPAMVLMSVSQPQTLAVNELKPSHQL